MKKVAGNSPTKALLSNLRQEGKTSPTRELAELLVDQHLERPLEDLIWPEETGSLLCELLLAWQRSDLAQENIQHNWQRLVAWLEGQHEPMGQVLPKVLLDGASELAAQPVRLNRELLLTMLDRPAVRKLIRELLVDTLISFGKKLRNPVAESRLGKGISGIGRMAKGRASGVRSLAGDLMGVVSDEVERQLEGRATEFADGALSQILHKLADYLCEPARAADQAALRRAFLDGLWDLTGAQLAHELSRADVEITTMFLRSVLISWLDRPQAKEDLASWLRTLSASGDFDSSAELLEALGMLQGVRSHAIEYTERNLRMVVKSKGFEAWLDRASSS